MREKLGRALHERFLEEQRGMRSADLREMRPWESLDEDLRESNRQHADDISAKLRAVGCDVEPVPGNHEAAGFTLSPEDIAVMARLEHERWSQEKRRAGWCYGEQKDSAAKTTPYLVEFDHLAPEVQQLDVDAVKAVLELLRRAGFRIYRIEGR
jgi:hypothetical protein